jgi:UDPglucose 6-dehydrogenase
MFCDNLFETVETADVLAIMTEWKVFRSPGFTRVKAALSEPIIFDGRNLYEPSTVLRAEIEYHAIGRPVESVSK